MTLSDRLRAIWLRLPAAVRAFLVDAVEASVTAVLLLNLAVPGSLDEAQAQALLVLAALGHPIVAAARRHLLPAVIGWLATTFPRP